MGVMNCHTRSADCELGVDDQDDDGDDGGGGERGRFLISGRFQQLPRCARGAIRQPSLYCTEYGNTDRILRSLSDRQAAVGSLEGLEGYSTVLVESMAFTPDIESIVTKTTPNGIQ
jgi:hypothetical protein